MIFRVIHQNTKWWMRHFLRLLYDYYIFFTNARYDIDTFTVPTSYFIFVSRYLHIVIPHMRGVCLHSKYTYCKVYRPAKFFKQNTQKKSVHPEKKYCCLKMKINKSVWFLQFSMKCKQTRQIQTEISLFNYYCIQQTPTEHCHH